MQTIKIITLSLLVTILAGCSGMSSRKTALTPEKTVAETSNQNADVKLLPKEIIPSSTNSCVDDMTLL